MSLGQGSEAGVLGPDHLDDRQQVSERPGNPVILRDCHNISRAELVDQLLELRPGSLRAGDFLSEDPLGASCL